MALFKKKEAEAKTPEDQATVSKADIKARKKELAEAKKEAPKEKPADLAYVSLRHVDKVYDNNVQAVFDFTLDIKKHEFIVFVGPSGCGKSTTLRMIAGLEDITNGELYIDGEYSNDRSPKDRDIAMVFQSYALYPHMTVYNNMAFGLKIRHLPKAEIDKRVHDAAKILQIEEYLDRKPKALSGGQRQRVALGRAIVRNAKVFLMDEPLSNLDAKLRVQMRSEIIQAPRSAQCDHDLRHPRPDRSHDHGLAHRRHEARPHPADRLADRDLQSSGQHLRRGLHRLAVNEPHESHLREGHHHPE
jgi:ABC-type nitrate/sulfonate/bicarbonate transport system ATPase subunit